MKRPTFLKGKAEREAARAKKDLDAIRKGAEPQDAPPPIPPPKKEGTTETQGGVSSLSEFPIGTKIAIELTRIKEGTATRITQAKGKIKIKGSDPKKFLFFVIGKSAYYVNPRKIIKVIDKKGRESFKLVYDVLYGEALDQDGTIDWDDELEMILADSGMDQYVTIAAYEGGFVFSPTIKRVMLIIGVLAFLGGLALNGSQHLIPTTVVHWVPSK